jgi:hypothetical protein
LRADRPETTNEHHPMSARSYLSAGFVVCSNGAFRIDAAPGQTVEQIVFDLRSDLGVARAAA